MTQSEQGHDPGLPRSDDRAAATSTSDPEQESQQTQEKQAQGDKGSRRCLQAS